MLSGIPEEAAPHDLEARCLKAVRDAREEASRAPRPTWFRAVQGLAAAAAVFFLVVSVATVKWPQFGLVKEKSLAMAPGKSMEARESAAKASPTLARERKWSGGMGGGGDQIAMHTPAAAPEGGPSAEYAADAAKDRVMAGRRVAASEAEAMGGARLETLPIPGEGDYDSYGAAPARPWRDLSGEKQKVISKTMEVEVPDVENAYRDAVSVIEKAEGIVVNEELRMDEKGRNRAHLYARIPVDRFDGVVAQIEDLGEIVELVGESEDRTKEYNARGGDIRDRGAEEVRLVEKYLKETNRSRKQQLFNRIQSLRYDNQRHKQGLSRLSEQTHFATLDLTLLQSKGPGQFLAQVLENSKVAAGWVAATAVLWVPALVIVWLGVSLARRRRAG